MNEASTALLAVVLAADAMFVGVLAARVKVGSPAAAAVSEGERFCGPSSLEHLADQVRLDGDELVATKTISGWLRHCGRWWFDESWSYSVCRSAQRQAIEERYCQLVMRAGDSCWDREEDPQFVRLPWRHEYGREALALATLVTHCEAGRGAD